MSTQHTPGPWTSDDPDKRFRHDNSLGVKGPDGMYVAAALDFNRADRDAEVAANARLIAIAPELLEAVMNASVQRDPRHRVSMLVNDWQRIEAAITKVAGTDR